METPRATRNPPPRSPWTTRSRSTSWPAPWRARAPARCRRTPRPCGYSGGSLPRRTFPRSLGGFAAADVYRFLTAIMDSPVSLGTRHRRFRETRAFFSWCLRMGSVPQHPFAGIANVKVEQKVIQPFSEEEIQQLLDACDAATAFGCRNRAIILLFLDTGMRALELLRVAVDDVHWETPAHPHPPRQGTHAAGGPVRGRARGGAARLHHALPRGGVGLSLPGHARRQAPVGAVRAHHAVRPAGPPGRRGPRPCPSLPAHLRHLGD